MKSRKAIKKEDKSYFCSIESQISGYTLSPPSRNESGVVYRSENGCKNSHVSTHEQMRIVLMNTRLSLQVLGRRTPRELWRHIIY